MEISAESSSAAPARDARTFVRRHAERGVYDADVIHQILDEAIICHVAVNGPAGPLVLPTAFARVGSELLLHGAAANALLQLLCSGSPACVTVTLVDGLVLARAAYNHSINYRSVVIFASAAEITDPDEKREALAAIVEHLVPGRGADARPPSESELRATRVVRLPITEASAKVRRGDPIDPTDDLTWPAWAGVIPLEVVAGSAVASANLLAPLEVPAYVRGYRREPG